MSSIEAVVRTLVAEKAELTQPVDQIGINEHLIEYGLHSVVYIQLIVAIEAHFQIEFDDMSLDIHSNPTIGHLVLQIQTYLSEDL